MQPPPLPDRYRPIAHVGEGATGTVWRATDELLGGEVAVKVVHANLALHARFRARFAREVAIGASVVHQRLIPVLDTGKLSDGRPFVALAYADQGSLMDLLEAGTSIDQVLRIVDEVLDALGTLHAGGLLHQDLKPENVLLHGSAEAPHAWVADLGVAGALSELAMDRRGISGTPRWMAPEQLAGRAQELGPWTDLYPVGLFLYLALGGVPPEGGLGARAVLERREELNVELPLEVPEPLVDVVEHLLANDPRQRYDRAADARLALRRATRGIELGGPAGDLSVVGRGTTDFPDTLLPEAVEQVTMPRIRARSRDLLRVPNWNRVRPGAMAGAPPAQMGWGARTSLTLFAHRDPPLLAREKVRRLLWLRAQEVIDTREPRVVLLVGDSDSGKGLVVDSVAQPLDASGQMETVRLSYHFPAGAEDGYRGAVRELLVPWHDTRFEAERRLSRWLARDQQTTPEATADEARALARWCGFQGKYESPVNAALGLAFLYRYLDGRAWRGGALLSMEDVHLCRIAGDGLDICEALLDRSVGTRPVLVVATLAAEALRTDPALQARVASLERQGAERVGAPRLSDEEIREYLSLGLRLAPRLAASLAPRCGGSPSFASMVVRDLAARGLLRTGAGHRFGLVPGVPLSQHVPSDMDALCRQRLSGALGSCEAPEAVDRALCATALAGQAPPVHVVRAVCEDGLDALIATGVVRQRGWRLTFEHDGIRRAARRRALRQPNVAELHSGLADAWEALGRTTGADVDLPLGVHRLHGGSPDRAVTPLLRSARTAQQEGRPSLGLDAARLAVAAADRADVLMAKAEARTRVAEALLELDRPDEALATLRGVRDVGKVDRRTQARIHVLLARAAMALGELADAGAHLRAAATTYEATRDWPGLVDTAHGEGSLQRLAGHPEAAALRFKRMLRINKGADPRAEVLALVGMVECHIAAGKLAGVGAMVERLRRVARTSGDTRNIGQATYAAGLLHLRLRELEQAERCFATSRALAATQGDDRMRMACANNLGEVLRFRGRRREAAESYGQAARLAEARGWSARAAVARLNLAILSLHQPTNTLARVEVDRADRLLQNHPKHWAWLFVGLLRALWAAEEGDLPNCRAWWSVANERGLKNIRSPDLWVPLERLSTAAAAQGWRDIAKRASALALSMAPTHQVDSVGVFIEE